MNFNLTFFQLSTRPSMDKLNFHWHLISQFYPTRKICKNFIAHENSMAYTCTIVHAHIYTQANLCFLLHCFLLFFYSNPGMYFGLYVYEVTEVREIPRHPLLMLMPNNFYRLKLGNSVYSSLYFWHLWGNCTNIFHMMMLWWCADENFAYKVRKQYP